MSDALVKLKFPNGGFLAGLTMFSPDRQAGPTKIVGPAYTVRYVLNDDPAPKRPTHYVLLLMPPHTAVSLHLRAARSTPSQKAPSSSSLVHRASPTPCMGGLCPAALVQAVPSALSSTAASET